MVSTTAQPTAAARTPDRLQVAGCFKYAAYAVLLLWAVVSLMPLFWMTSISVSNVVTLLKMPPSLLPDPLTFDNFTRLLQRSMLPRWLLNSIIVSGSNTVISLFVSSFYGYIFAKKVFPGGRFLFGLLISTLMVPFFVVVIPVFLTFRDFHLLNTYWALIIPSVFSAYGVFLMRQTIKTLPGELTDAALIDGCSQFGVYWRVILPLSKPGLAVLGIFTFVGSWNDFFWPLIVLNDPNMYTLQVGLPTLQGQWTDYGLVMAASTIAALPTILIFLAFQRYFVQGVTVGALKG
ncbi:MAG: ABC transporter permease subunit [Chloroflexi bacterium]|nr:ABC transporter permease subunit [Chloroflexota bacterium]